jgi:hypothetical protein
LGRPIFSSLLNRPGTGIFKSDTDPQEGIRLYRKKGMQHAKKK